MSDPILQEMPFDPAGVVEWTGKHRVARCGDYTGGGMGQGCCRQLFKFRGCIIMGKEIYATACNVCSLKYDLVAATLPAQADKFADELAGILGCDREQAKDAAWDAFGYLATHHRWGRAKKTDKTRNVRRPDGED